MLREILVYILVAIIALLPVGIWLPLYYFADKSREKFKLIIKTFLLGALTAVPLILIQTFGFNISDFLAKGIYGLIFGILLLAVLEEGVKLFSTTLILNKYPKAHDEITDGIIYAVSIALGFTFIENAYFFTQLMRTDIPLNGLAIVFLFRGLGTMLAHTVFSGIFGYYYAKAFFDIRKHQVHGIMDTLEDEIHASIYALRSEIYRKRLFKDIHKFNILFKGGIIAISLHILYNLSMHFHLFGPYLSFLVFPLILVGLLFLLKKE